ncbi:MAG: hypothetical protein Q8O56_06370 [Solirubrobacteraceae bacterium]|nr:hypothetical protein [Solirubrobacteraceae bacterium]
MLVLLGLVIGGTIVWIVRFTPRPRLALGIGLIISYSAHLFVDKSIVRDIVALILWLLLAYLLCDRRGSNGRTNVTPAKDGPAASGSA